MNPTINVSHIGINYYLLKSNVFYHQPKQAYAAAPPIPPNTAPTAQPGAAPITGTTTDPAKAPPIPPPTAPEPAA